MVFLILRIEVAQTAAPFFSNDITGFVRVLVTVVAPIVFTILSAFLVIFKYNWNKQVEDLGKKLEESMREINHDLNRMGEKLNEAQADQRETAVRGDEMSKQVDRHELQIEILNAGVKTISESVREIHVSVERSGKEIRDLISMSKDELRDKISEANKKLYAFEQYMERQERQSGR